MTNRQYMRIYYREHREELLAKKREAYREHREEKLEANKKYKQTLKARVANSEKRNLRYRTDPEYRAKCLASARAYREKKKQLNTETK